MKISLNELKKYVDINIPNEELLQLIGSRLVEIEGVEDLSEKYQGIKVVKVATCEPIEGTHLHLCQVQKSENSDDLIQVVCGAPNVHAGMLAAWIMPGSIVPETFGGENFRLGVRKLRGFESHGMLAAADELGFAGGSHDGIIELDPATARPGGDFAEAYGLHDLILDIENKSLTHRPDTFGLIGFAREIAGILGTAFHEPAIFSKKTEKTSECIPEASDNIKTLEHAPETSNNIKITIEDEKICPRYTCAVIDLPEDFKLEKKYFDKNDVFLYKAGMRPISKTVDLTNILMLETGQPLHAFDYDKFLAVAKEDVAKENIANEDTAKETGNNSDTTDVPEIKVRLARVDETHKESLTLLDGTEIELNPTDIVICSGDTPVALAGAMGGKSTEIDATTKRIILESATFSLYNLRKTQMSHGIFSEAITRFTKGVPPYLCLPVLKEFIKKSTESVVKNTTISSTFLADCYPSPTSVNPISVTVKEVNSLLGSSYTKSQVISTLENVGFVIEQTENDILEITAPAWRTDIHIREDVIEEVGRLLGYDNIPLDFPTRKFIGAKNDDNFSKKSKLRHILSDTLGMNEVLTYSFVSKALLASVGENPDNLYNIINSISPELECFRSSLIPSLLDKIKENQRAGYDSFSLYEMNQVSSKTMGLNEENVPNMETHLAVINLGDYYLAKFQLENLLTSLGIDYEIKPSSVENPLFEKKHSADFLISDTLLATVGEIKTSVLAKFKLKGPVSAFELKLDSLKSENKATRTLPRFSRFPSTTRDLTLVVSEDVLYSSLENSIKTSLREEENLVSMVACLSIYQDEKAKANKTRNVSFRLTLSSTEKTLDSLEISAIMERAQKNLEKFHVSII